MDVFAHPLHVEPDRRGIKQGEDDGKREGAENTSDKHQTIKSGVLQAQYKFSNSMLRMSPRCLKHILVRWTNGEKNSGRSENSLDTSSPLPGSGPASPTLVTNSQSENTKNPPLQNPPSLHGTKDTLISISRCDVTPPSSVSSLPHTYRDVAHKWTVEELLGQGFSLTKWDGCTPPLVDAKRRIFSALAGGPKDPSDCEAAYHAMASEPKGFDLQEEVRYHRGNFPAMAAGVSYRNGQTDPSRPAAGETGPNADGLHRLLDNREIQRIGLYTQTMGSDALLILPIHTVQSSKHRDLLNLAFGWTQDGFVKADPERYNRIQSMHGGRGREKGLAMPTTLDELNNHK
ncbi:hypothetical protein AB1N83_012793 [Pleurotus pulmonarius]